MWFWAEKNKANLLSFCVLRSADSAKMSKRNLKKQTQFWKGEIGVSVYIKEYYEDFHWFQTAENKPKQSQFLQKDI